MHQLWSHATARSGSGGRPAAVVLATGKNKQWASLGLELTYFQIALVVEFLTCFHPALAEDALECCAVFVITLGTTNTLVWDLTAVALLLEQVLEAHDV